MMRWLIVGLVASLLTLLGGVLVDANQAAFSWLFAWALGMSVALGALILVLIGNAAGSKWFLVVRRPAEAIAGSLFVLAPLVLPVLLGMHRLYAWTDPAGIADTRERRLVEKKQIFLNPTFFTMRTLVYLALFLLAIGCLLRWSRRQDESADPALTDRQRTFSLAMLPAVGLALSFGAFDWLMSLMPAWHSTVFGIYYWVGGFVAAIAVLVLVSLRREELSGSHFHALGRLMLAFTIFWAYIAYAQGFIVWITNRPDEVIWYLPRVAGSWGDAFVVLIFIQFVTPFGALLVRDLKFQRRKLAIVAGIIVAAHVLDVYWMVLPALHPSALAPSWMDLTALLGVLGLAAAGSLAIAARQANVPLRAPELPLGLRYRSL